MNATAQLISKQRMLITPTWVLNRAMVLIRTKELLKRWNARWHLHLGRVHLGLHNQWMATRVMTRVRRSLLLWNKARSLIKDWQLSTLVDWELSTYYSSLYDTTDDDDDKDYIPIRPTKNKKRKYSCSWCGVKNQHYMTTCPKKLDYDERNARIAAFF